MTAPASTAGRDGLGPLFNARSCSSHHVRDGRAAPPEDADDPERGLLFRLGVAGDGGVPEPHRVLGSQLQDQAIRDVPAEGSVVITRTERPGEYDDGTPYSPLDPSYEVRDELDRPLDHLLVSPRIAPAVFGVGLLGGSTVLVEEEGWLADGTPLVVDGAAPSAVGDAGIWFLTEVRSGDGPVHVVVSSQGRYLMDGDRLRGAAGDDPLVAELSALGVDELATRIAALPARSR